LSIEKAGFFIPRPIIYVKFSAPPLFYVFYRKNVHRAVLYADTARNALAGFGLLLIPADNLLRARFETGQASDAYLFIDHVHTLVVPGDSSYGAYAFAYSALVAETNGFGSHAIVVDTDAGKLRVEYLIEGKRTAVFTGMALNAVFRMFYY
jgi:hypothetical protein